MIAIWRASAQAAADRYADEPERLAASMVKTYPSRSWQHRSGWMAIGYLGLANAQRSHSQAWFIAAPALSTMPTQNMKP